MPLKIGINGFGRIGRMVLRASMRRDDIEVVAINDPFITPDYMVYQFKYDSCQGRYDGTVTSEADGKTKSLVVDGQKITVFQERDPKKIQWGKAGVAYVAECTGIFTEDNRNTDQVNGGKGAEQHLVGGARKVIISAPSKSAPMYCMNVNTDEFEASQDIISNASCTTNCLAPLVKVLDDAFGIEYGLMSTIHAVTATQKTVDAPCKKWRSGRGGFSNIIPASTGAAQAIGKVIKSLDGKLGGNAYRVPVVNGSVVDLTVLLKKSTNMLDVQSAMKRAANNELKGILGYSTEPIVSSDIIGMSESSIFDARASMMMNKHLVKVIAWYDNEWGYSCRLLDLCAFVATKDVLHCFVYGAALNTGVYGAYTISMQEKPAVDGRRLCQRCNKQFDLAKNTEKSCAFHRSSYVQRSDDDGAWFGSWDCCGALRADAKCCGFGEHITFDVKWSKNQDFDAHKVQIIDMGQDCGTWIYHPTRGYIMVKWSEEDDLKAIPIMNKVDGQDDIEVPTPKPAVPTVQSPPPVVFSDAKHVVSVVRIYEICEKYHKQRLSKAIEELATELPFTAETNKLIAKTMILDLIKNKKLSNIQLIYDLEEQERNAVNKSTDNMIAGFSSNTLDQLADFM